MGTAGARLLLAALLVAGCTTTAPTPTPTSSSAATAPATSTPTGGGCLVPEQSGLLRSDTIVDLVISTDGFVDRVEFLFDPPSRPDIISTGRLRSVEPPFTRGASGEPVEIAGTHFVEVRLDGMLIHDEAGNPYFLGERSSSPDGLAIRQVELIEAFEAIIIFVVGYDGDGCVGLADDPATRTLTLTIGR